MEDSCGRISFKTFPVRFEFIPPPDGWNFECGDDKIVDEIGYNAKCNETTVATIPNPSNVFEYVVEIVYKGSNPGQTIQFTDAGGASHNLLRSVPVGGSSNVWVYRGFIPGSTSSITYIDTIHECKLQSIVIYAFRNVVNASSSSGVFTSRSGFNDIQIITINVPSFTEPRDLIVEAPISELTEDGRYLLFRAEAGGVSEEIFIFGPDPGLPGGTCCLAIPKLTLSAVPGAATQVTITVDSRNNQNGQSVNGQSWVIASAVNVDGDCPLNTTDAINDINNTFVDLPVAGNVLTNDEDAQGDNQTVTTIGAIATTAGGVAVMMANGDYIYTPPAGYSGADTFQYSIEDDALPPRMPAPATDTATVFIEIIGDPNTTIAHADTAGTLVNTSVNGNVLTNDFDPEGHNQEVTNIGLDLVTTQGGLIDLAANGVFTYTPPLDFIGEDTFEYFIQDDAVPPFMPAPAVDSAILSITVTSVNSVFANDDAYLGCQDLDITGNVLDNDSDPQGDTILVDTNVTPVSGPSNGSLVIFANGTFTYSPDTGYFGPDEFVYEIFDSGNPVARDQATVHLLILPANTTDAVNDINNTLVDLPVAGNVLTNDEDAQGDNQTVTTVGAIATTAGGVAVMMANGDYIYTPPAGYSGADTFQYSIEDDALPPRMPAPATDTATVFIEIIGDPNTTIAHADTAGTLVNTSVNGNVLTNDFDPEGHNQEVTNIGLDLVTTQGGLIDLAANGVFTYTPPLDFIGEDTFEYFIQDDAVPPFMPAPAVDSAILSITVTSVNSVFANDDAYLGCQDLDITGNVLDNDSDPQGDTILVDTNVTPVSGPSNGSLVIFANGTFTYSPDPGYFGPDEFVYEIFDNGNPVARDQATVHILILPAATPPVSTGDITECEDDPIQTLDANDAITPTSGQSVVWYDAATGGNVVANPILNTVGTVTYWAEGVTDGDACSSLNRTAVTLTIEPAAIPPVSTGDITECEDDPIQTLDANDAITQTSGQSVVWYDAATGGNVVANPILNTVGTVTYWAEGVTDGDACSSLNRTAVVLSIGACSMSVEKTGVFNDENGDGSAQVGETISYNFKVTNTGSVTLYNITLDDPLPGIMIEGGPIEILLPGEFDDSTFTATYVITQNDIDNLEVVNQAIGSGVDGDGNEITDLSDDPTTNEPNDPTVVILPLVDEPFEIFNCITPDGDGLNDFFFIQGIEEYPNNNMKIYNRWGIKVFEINGYGGSTGTEFVFSGISDGRTTIRKNEELPTGTYYYVLTIFGENPGKSSYAGYLYINR